MTDLALPPELAPAPTTLDDEAIHEWFGLTYANYLVLHRTILQSMPPDWQREFVILLEELRDAAQDVPGHDVEFWVRTKDADGRFVRDLVPHYQRGRARVPLRPARAPRRPVPVRYGKDGEVWCGARRDQAGSAYCVEMAGHEDHDVSHMWAAEVTQ